MYSTPVPFMTATDDTNQTGWAQRAGQALRSLGGRVKERVYGDRVRTPTVLQMEAAECGAASLGIVLGYHGRRVPLEKLRVACDVSRDGTSAGNIVKTARDYGLKAKGFRKSLDTVQEMTFPVIIHWNFNHFLVLEGFKGDFAYLNDPAKGRYRVTLAEFDDAFTGVVLAFERGPDFEAEDEKEGIVASLAPRLSSSTTTLSFVVLASLGLVIPGLVVPAFTRIFIDQFLVQRMHDWVVPLLLCMGGVMGLNAALTWVQQRYLLRLETKLSLSMSSAFLWHVLRLPVEFFAQRYSGEVGSRVQINDRVAELLAGRLATTLLSVVTVGFYLALMFAYDVVLSLVSLGIAAVNAGALLFVSRRRKEGSRRLQQDRGKLMGTTMSGLNRIETLKASGSESDYYERWAGHLAKMVNAEQDLGVYTRALGVVPSLLGTLNTVAVFVVGAVRVMDGALTIGLLIAFKYLMDNFLQPVNRLVRFGSLLQEAEGDLARLNDVLRYDADPQVQRDASSEGGAGPNGRASTNGTAALRGRLDVEGLTFGYSRLKDPFIEDFDVTIRPGERVALVGASGSGKSTVARLVCGLHDPWSGTIRFDGTPRADWPRATLTNSLAFVDQDILVFADTVRNNLTLWDDTIPDAHVVRAAKDACIHDEIASRQGGYDGPVREGGRNFSGGQRQRLEIARSLAQTPSLLVLDEATSALDTATEKQIMDNVRRRGCACLVVAHRLSTIRDCDEILVLDDGAVTQRGTHDTLIASEGRYAELLQAGEG